MPSHTALENLMVLDLTRVLAGPFCTMMLADMGAHVIKIEIPRGGDYTRAYPPFRINRNGEKESIYFANINRNKSGITLDLKSEEGKNLFCELVKKADIVVENYRPGVMDKLGLGYDELKKAGFKGGDSLFLIAAYFAGKPDKTITPLLRRLQIVMKDREDLISGGMLAASYYGMEELSMRIPVLEEGVRNLYTDQEDIEALTGSIMIADGGPAEVAKAIQWYMFFVKNGFDVKKRQMARVIGLLAVISSSPVMVGRQLMNRTNESIGRYEKEQKDKNYMQDTFCEQVCTYIRQLQRKEQEKARRLEKTSYRMLTGEKNVTVADYTQEEEVSLNGSNMLVGMEQEVGLVLSAIHMGL